MPLSRQGLVYLSGPNGGGKSTPFETLQHILFGTTSRGVRKDQIVCAVPGSDGFLGEVVLTNPDGRWFVRQSRNHSRHKTAVKVMKEVDGKWSARWEGGGCPKKLEDAQKLAGSLLGLQPHEFAGCMYLSQAGAHTLIEGTPGDKMRYVAQLFGIDICDRMVVRLRGELKEAEQQTVDVPVLEAQLAERKTEAEQYDVPSETDLAVLDGAMTVAAEHKARLRDLIYTERDAIAGASQRERLQQQRDKLGRVGDSESLKARARRLSDKRDTLRDRQGLRDSRAWLEAELARYDVTESAEELARQLAREREALQQVRDLTARLDRRESLEKALAHVNHDGGAVEDVQERLSQYQRDQAETSALHRARSRELSVLSDCEDGTCPTCQQSVAPEYMDRLVPQLTTELAALQARGREASKNVQDWAVRLTAAEQYWEFQEELSGLPEGSLTEERERVAGLVRVVERLEATRCKALQRATLERQRDALPDPGDDVTERLARTELLLTAVTEEGERAGRAELLDRQLAETSAVDVEASRRTVELAEQVLEELEGATEVIRERRVRAGVAADDYADLCESVRTVEAALERLAGPRGRVHVLRYAVDAIQKLKRRKLHQVVEAIRDCLPRFAGTMFSHEPNTRFVVSSDEESLDLVCRRRVDGQAVDIPVKSLSGGEKQRLSVALVFTLHALLHARKRPDLLILDEVDRGLDDVGIASLMSLVRGVREQYGTVIMTSHRSQIAGAAFDRTWTVTKADEVSCLQLDGGNECLA